MAASTITPDSFTPYSYLLHDINQYLPITRNHVIDEHQNDKVSIYGYCLFAFSKLRITLKYNVPDIVH